MAYDIKAGDTFKRYDNYLTAENQSRTLTLVSTQYSTSDIIYLSIKCDSAFLDLINSGLNDVTLTLNDEIYNTPNMIPRNLFENFDSFRFSLKGDISQEDVYSGTTSDVEVQPLFVVNLIKNRTSGDIRAEVYINQGKANMFTGKYNTYLDKEVQLGYIIPPQG